MTRVVVTGATGLIGSRVLTALVAQGNEVHALARAPGAASGVHWHRADLAAPTLPDLPTRCDAVVHLAQSARFREFPVQAGDIFAVNTASTARLLDYARRAGCRTFVLASTGGVYAARAAPLDEAAPLAEGASLGFYAATKLAAELIARQYEGSFSVVVLRFFFVYGAGQAEHMLVPRLVASVRDRRPIRLAGEEGIRINPTYVDDAAAAVVGALGLERGATLNVAGPEALSLRALATLIGDGMGTSPIFEVTEEGAGHLVADTTRMRSMLPAAAVTPREGIARLLAARD